MMPDGEEVRVVRRRPLFGSHRRRLIRWPRLYRLGLQPERTVPAVPSISTLACSDEEDDEYDAAAMPNAVSLARMIEGADAACMANSPPRRRHDSPSHLQYQSVHTGMTLSGVSECAELLLAPPAYRAELVMHLPRPEATTTTMVALSRTQGPRHSRAQSSLTPSTACYRLRSLLTSWSSASPGYA